MSSINIKKRKKIRASAKTYSYLYSIIKNTNMIIIVNRGLNENGAKKMNEYIIELRDKKLKDPEYLATLWIFERKIHSGMCKPVKVGDKIGSATKTYKRDWDSVKEYATMGTHLGYTLPLDYFDYEIIKV